MDCSKCKYKGREFHEFNKGTLNRHGFYCDKHKFSIIRFGGDKFMTHSCVDYQPADLQPTSLSEIGF